MFCVPGKGEALEGEDFYSRPAFDTDTINADVLQGIVLHGNLRVGGLFFTVMDLFVRFVRPHQQ